MKLIITLIIDDIHIIRRIIETTDIFQDESKVPPESNEEWFDKSNGNKKRKIRHFSQDEVNFILENYGSMRIKDIAKHLGRDLIKLQGHTIRAAHDAGMHKWKFIMLKWDNGYYIEDREFFTISEKKGQAILDFLNALAAVTKKSSSRPAAKNEKNIVQDHDEDFFNLASQDPAAQSEEIIDMPEVQS